MTTDTWTEFPNRLRALCGQHSLVVDEACISRCWEHLQVLLRWNRKMNLVGDLSLASAVERHYGESLYLASLLPQRALAIADIGSGAGFPGTVLAAVRRDCGVLLVESREKRAVFLKESTRDWPNCSVFHGMAESIDDFVDVFTARAVANDLLESLAVERQAGLAMLVSADVAHTLSRTLQPYGYRCDVSLVPWRPAAAAFVAFME